MMRMHVHIDRLTLEGKTHADGRRIVEAIERHLTALANGGERLRVESGPLAHHAGVDAVGSRIATEVFHKIGGTSHA